jgi:hypothetical protein
MSLDFTHLYPDHLGDRAVQRVDGRAPAGTNIKLLGLTDSAANLLTPVAARLTKADLEALAVDPALGDRLGLSVTDINSIKVAFTTPMQISPLSPMSVDVKCCCCTPCCCAAAVPIDQAVC